MPTRMEESSRRETHYTIRELSRKTATNPEVGHSDGSSYRHSEILWTPLPARTTIRGSPGDDMA